MAISRAQLAKELEPGLNALFGLEYARYEDESAEIYDTESSERAFEEEVMLSGFGSAPVKQEGSAVTFDDAQEAYTARYTHETIALAFSITEEAIEDNLYDRLASRYTKALARSMANTKQVKAAATLNNAFDSNFAGGDGKELCATDHPLVNNGTLRNEPSTDADLNETSLENALIDIAAFVDERAPRTLLQPWRRRARRRRSPRLGRAPSCSRIARPTVRAPAAHRALPPVAPPPAAHQRLPPRRWRLAVERGGREDAPRPWRLRRWRQAALRGRVAERHALWNRYLQLRKRRRLRRRVCRRCSGR